MRSIVGVAVAGLVAAAAFHAFSPRELSPPDEIRVPVARMHLNDIEETTAGLLVAGELGNILVSPDGGQHWRDVSLPAQRQAVITRFAFFDASVGLALGHEGWILRTTDGGQSWLEAAFDDVNGTPLMDAAVLPSGEWLVVGAFGRAMISTDQGLTWEDTVLAEDNDWHLNRITSSADRMRWMIVGEAGTVLRSDDAGASWEAMEPFYDGSLYGAIHLGDETWLAYGMRGNVFRSDDDGFEWEQVALPAPVSIYTHATTAANTLLLAGQGGMIFESSDLGRTFKLRHRADRGSVTGIHLQANGDVLLSGDRGLYTKAGFGANDTRTASANSTPATKGENQ